MKKTPAVPPRTAVVHPAPSPGQLAARYYQLVRLTRLGGPAGCYQRVWTPLITLWYLLWQRLQPQHTLEAVVTDARRGGADRLGAKGKRLSRRIQSRATTAFSDARQRLPLPWVYACFLQLAQALRTGSGLADPALAMEVLDGSTLRFRPHGDLPQAFPPHRTRARKPYWCGGRVLVSFCARSGVAIRARIASLRQSEQALAVQLMLESWRNVLYVGDRNLGVWRGVRAAQQSGGHALVRLTKVRARRLWGKKRLPRFGDRPCQWTPTSRDQVDPGLTQAPVAGCWIVIHAVRRGYRAQALHLFTTFARTPGPIRAPMRARRILSQFEGSRSPRRGRNARWQTRRLQAQSRAYYE